jgi:predicted nucleotidyltransferase
MNPFLPDEVEALRALVRTWPNARMVVLGAAVLRCFMPMSWRTTEDLDLTVAASIEDATAALSKLPGWSSDSRQEQRWRTPVGIAVDIVPASTEALARGYVEWPRTGFRMSLLGMRLAFRHAVAHRLAADLEVRAAPIHVISALKMIAYLDRPEVRAKDLGDLAHIMDRYVGDDSDRRFSVEVPDDLTEFDDVSPYLLGRDVGALVDLEERGRIMDFVTTIDDDARGPQVLARMSILGPPAWRDPDAVLERLRAFQRGMEVL